MAAADPQHPESQQTRVAASYHIPSERIVAIEHPGIVRNFANGIKSLGGDAQLKHVLEHHVGDSKLSGRKQNQLPEPVAGVSLRPNDPLAKRIPSTGVETRNVLVKVSVPKRTGRKRKRGSDEPFTDPVVPEEGHPVSITAADLLQRLRDNEGKYTIEPVGMLRETHRFRTLPDFQIRNADLPIMRQLRDHATTPDYDRIKNFYIDPAPVPHNTVDAFPGPPTFTSIDMPHKYEYQQASTVVVLEDESGNLTTKNIAAPTKRLIWGLPPDVKEIPRSSPIEIPRRSSHGEMLPLAIQALEKLLAERPLVTKRVALNSVPPMSDTVFKEATQFVGYTFKAGPWRDSLIKYGVDPRKDPKYRFYQTMMFQIDAVAFKSDQSMKKTNTQASEHKSHWARTFRHKRDDPNTHIFDGKNITANGKTWQVCDVQDPIVHEIFATETIREECDVFQWGWYHCGTIAKARTIMKDKMRYLFAGDTPPESVYQSLNLIPDILTEKNVRDAYLDPKVHGRHACELSCDIRNLVKGRELHKSRKSQAHRMQSQGSEQPDGADGGNESDAPGLDDDDLQLRELDVGDDDEDGQGDFADMDVQSPTRRVENEEGEGDGGGG